MAGYLAENYCPTLGEHAQDCPENLAGHYPDMVNAVVDRLVRLPLSRGNHPQQVHRWGAGRRPHVPVYGRLQACAEDVSFTSYLNFSLQQDQC